MSRTEKGSKGPGHDWWSRRPNAGMSASSRKAGTIKWWKRNTHKIERQQAKRQTG